MRKDLFLSLQKKLLAIKDNDGKPLVKFFNLWHNRINYIEQPFDTPAVFIEFRPLVWKTLSGTQQQISEFSFILHIVSRYYNVTHSTAPSDVQSEQLNFLDIPDLIHSALHKTRVSSCGTIVHRSSSLDYNYSDFIQSLEEYVCLIGSVPPEDNNAVYMTAVK